MFELGEPLYLQFKIAATDPLGREEVVGKLCFLPHCCEIHWRLSDNVFRGGKGDHERLEITYDKIERVRLQKKWFRPALLSFCVTDPSLLKDIPNVVMGTLTFEVQKKSHLELQKLQRFIDFKQSLFLFERTDAHLDKLRKE